MVKRWQALFIRLLSQTPPDSRTRMRHTSPGSFSSLNPEKPALVVVSKKGFTFLQAFAGPFCHRAQRIFRYLDRQSRLLVQ